MSRNGQTVTPERHEEEPQRDLSPFAAALLALREQKGLTQMQVAALSGMSAGYIGLIETGKRGTRPSYDVVKRFAQALALNVDETEQLMRTAGHLGMSESLWRAGEKFTTRAAIEADPILDTAQKQILLGVYDNMTRGAVTSATRRRRSS